MEWYTGTTNYMFPWRDVHLRAKDGVRSLIWHMFNYYDKSTVFNWYVLEYNFANYYYCYEKK